MNLGNHSPRLSLSMRSDFPVPMSTTSRKTITPFNKAKKNGLRSPKSKTSNSKSKNLDDNQKTVTNEEFHSMLEIKEKVSPTVPSLLGRSLFDLSLCLRPLTDVLDQIKIFKYNAPLHLYKYSSLIKLISAAVKCPPDATLLLLSIGKKMIKAENYAKPEYLHELIKITQNMISKKYNYETYKDQKKPQKKLLKLLEIFRGALTMSQKNPEGTYGTSEIEKIMEKQQMEKKMKSSSNSPKHKRKRLKTPTKPIDILEENNNDNKNEKEKEKEKDKEMLKEFVGDEDIYDYATTPIRRSTNPKLLPVRTPKTGTPRKPQTSNPKQRKNTKNTPKTAKASKSNLPFKNVDTPKSARVNKNIQFSSNDETTKSTDISKSSPENEKDNQPQKIEKSDETQTNQLQKNNTPRPYLNIYSDSEPEPNDKTDNDKNNDVNSNNNNNNNSEKNNQLKPNDPLGQSKLEFETNKMEINAIDFANVKQKKVRKSTSTIDVGLILSPNSPKQKKKSKHSFGDPRLKNLPIELDFHSSTLNSSSFLNIIGNAMSDFDDNASQATTQSGINSISKELRDVLFDGPDSESSEIHSHEESIKVNKQNNVNNDLYLQAKRLATVITVDAADYVEPDSGETTPKINHIKDAKTIYSSETSSIFKDEDDNLENEGANFFERLRSPSETYFASVLQNKSIKKSPEKDESLNNENENQDSNHGFKKMRPAPLEVDDPRGKLNEEEELNEIEEEEEKEKENNDDNDENNKKIADIDSLSEIPDSVDEEEFKPRQVKVPTLVLESIQNNLDSVSENINSPLNSIQSNRLSTTGTSPYSGNLSSDYSPGLSTSPRRFDSTGIIDIMERKPSVILENSNEIHIDIQPEIPTSIISNSPVSNFNEENEKEIIDIQNENEINDDDNNNKDIENIEFSIDIVDDDYINNNNNKINNENDETDKTKRVTVNDSNMIKGLDRLEWSERNDLNDDDHISLSMTKKSKQFWSIEKFLNSKGNIYQRRIRGAKLYEGLDQGQVKQISELASLFTAWNTAYSSSKVVWDVMKNDDKFDIDVLLSQIPISYGDFLIEGLTTFAQNEGIHIKEISHPL